MVWMEFSVMIVCVGAAWNAESVGRISMNAPCDAPPRNFLNATLLRREADRDGTADEDF